ncbi:uncharacterized protein LAESUDRAFT_551215 [Laetiporus sulphureus 93-53]|uniref:Uncharacterized protein n=1 Tax=Laetiporus sulphureus 93-53 TaxID=1314785 RepID=A0A165FT27_9APHY|nr:uncharacterized protein LAESUDRAFT_551215 [Laetiporus sulphureus 93-53]KZT09375.1 hypothetical protein LAESUDRAFT_551215 [Laetiporus sulphureus 93-53]
MQMRMLRSEAMRSHGGGFDNIKRYTYFTSYAISGILSGRSRRSADFQETFDGRIGRHTLISGCQLNGDVFACDVPLHAHRTKHLCLNKQNSTFALQKEPFSFVMVHERCLHLTEYRIGQVHGNCLEPYSAHLWLGGDVKHSAQPPGKASDWLLQSAFDVSHRFTFAGCECWNARSIG